MILELSSEALEYGRLTRRAIGSAGGDQLLQQAEAKPETREALVGPVLAELGVWELEPHTDTESREAAAALCHSAGYWALPYPVAERLCRTDDFDGMLVVPEVNPAAGIGGLDLDWLAVTVTGRCSRVITVGQTHEGFVADLGLSEDTGTTGPALALVLSCWTLLGMLDRALELTIAHVKLRQQFGQPLAAFQGVQFQLTDAEVERAGVEMLAKHALWSVGATPDEALSDALGARLAAIEAADVVFRVCHQLHGAVGFCDETTLSWLSRYSQPVRRLPFGLSATRTLLTEQIGTRGLSGLFTP